MSPTGVIFHVTTREAWAEAERTSVYRSGSLEAEGFIHFSTPEQVVEVATFLFTGRKGLVLLYVAPERLHAELRYEALGASEPYPHLYGPLNIDAVLWVSEFEPDADGFKLPADPTRDGG